MDPNQSSPQRLGDHHRRQIHGCLRNQIDGYHKKSPDYPEIDDYSLVKSLDYARSEIVDYRERQSHDCCMILICCDCCMSLGCNYCTIVLICCDSRAIHKSRILPLNIAVLNVNLENNCLES